MKRLPRRSSKIQLPLRGRLAAVANSQQKSKYSEPIIRQRLSPPKSVKRNIPQEASTYEEVIPQLETRDSSLTPSKSVEIEEPDSINAQSLPTKSISSDTDLSPTFVSIKLWQWLLAFGLLGLLIFSLYH